MTKLNHKHGRRSERGFALFIAIFTLLLITAIAAGMLMLTNTDTNISSNFRDEQTSFFAAKAGLEEVRDRMRVNAVNSSNVSVSLNNPTAPGVQVLPGASAPNSAPPMFGSALAITYITNPLNGESDTPWVTNGSAYPDDEICNEALYAGSGNGCSGNPPRPRGTSNWYSTASANSSYASNPVQAWKWVRINVKTNQTSTGTTTVSTVDGNTADYNLVCWNGTNQLTVAAGSCASAGAALIPAQNYTPVYTLTALAVTPSGSRRMVQMDVATDTIPNIPGALVMDGPALAANFGPGSSNAFQASGTDHSSSLNALRPQNGTVCPPPGSEPALGAYDAASAAPVTGLPGSFAGPPNRSGNYTGSPANVANVSTQLGDGGMNTVQGLTQLVNVITASAVSPNVYSTAAALTNPGTVTAPVVNVVTGDASFNNLTGSGILLVQGNLTLSGNPNFNGIILVIGKGNVSWSGGGNGTIDGAMLVANLYNSSNQLLTSGAPGIPTITFSGGGTMNVNYDSCWVAAMNQMTPYKSLGVREMAY